MLGCLTWFRGAGPELEGLVAKVPALRAILGSITAPLQLAADFKPEMPTHHSGVLKESMPSCMRNGATHVVDPLFFPGHLGDPDAQSPALLALIKSLKLDNHDVAEVALMNVTACGKTKTALELLRVRGSCLVVSHTQAAVRMLLSQKHESVY